MITSPFNFQSPFPTLRTPQLYPINAPTLALLGEAGLRVLFSCLAALWINTSSAANLSVSAFDVLHVGEMRNEPGSIRRHAESLGSVPRSRNLQVGAYETGPGQRQYMEHNGRWGGGHGANLAQSWHFINIWWMRIWGGKSASNNTQIVYC